MKTRSFQPLFITISALIGLALFAMSAIGTLRASSAGPLAVNAALAAPADGTESLPPGASIETVLPNMNLPIAMAFDPSGRLFYTEKTGAVRLFTNGTLQTDPVITFNADSGGERGLLGIAIDPNFNSNHYIYVYYTCAVGPGCASTENRVVHFTENNGVGSNPVTIFASPQTAPNHNGGNIHFGPDGKLYISIGDNANAANSQDVTVKNGKMHRINPDGTIPPDNPVFTQTGALPSLYVMGLRNTFDFVFDPPTPGRIFASENGPSCDDEMNRIEAGYNYGWRASYPCDDGNPSPVYNTIPPLWHLPSAQCCEAPTGITVYSGSQIPQWQNGLFMVTYNTGKLRHFYLDPSRTFVTATNVVLGVAPNMDIETGPDGALWYMEGGGYSPGTLKRIVGSGPTSTPAPPTNTPLPTHTPTPTNTPLPTQTPGGPTATPVPTVCTLNFEDVPSTNPFYSYIRCLACRDIISGYHCGGPGEPCNPSREPYFRPGNNVTRGQTAKIVSNSAGYAEAIPASQQTFTDVLNTDPFWVWVERIAMHGIISGYTCGVPPAGACDSLHRQWFLPGNDVTRGQLAKIVSSVANYNETIPSGQQTFTDVTPGSTFWVWIERVKLHGVISGYNCGSPPAGKCDPQQRRWFLPYNTATRGQTSKVVGNAFFPSCQTP